MPALAFVSMPFGERPSDPENEWTKLFNSALKPLEAQVEDLPDDVSHEPIQLFRADIQCEALSLKVNVMRGIERSAFMICVLTTATVNGSTQLRLSNPNVLWELGYAEALGKPIIVMADNNSLRQLPILAGQPNVCIYSHDLVKAATFEEAPDALRPITRSLVPYIAQASEEARKGGVRGRRSHALTYARRDAIDLKSMIGSAREHVDILTTNLNYFLSDKLSANTHPIEMALKNGATVRLVTMDPESVITEYRAKQLVRGGDIPGYRKELRQGIIGLAQKFSTYPNFHLHIYNDLPLQITFRVDDSIITSVVTRGERSRTRIQIQFNLHDEGVIPSFISHFQSVFDTSADVRSVLWASH